MLSSKTLMACIIGALSTCSAVQAIPEGVYRIFSVGSGMSARFSGNSPGVQVSNSPLTEATEAYDLWRVTDSDESTGQVLYNLGAGMFATTIPGMVLPDSPVMLDQIERAALKITEVDVDTYQIQALSQGLVWTAQDPAACGGVVDHQLPLETDAQQWFFEPRLYSF